MKRIDSLSTRLKWDGLDLVRWLRMAVDRLGLMPSEIYLPLGIKSETWGTWTSLEDDRTPPLATLPTILSNLDDRAFDEFVSTLRSLRDEARNEKVPARTGTS